MNTPDPNPDAGLPPEPNEPKRAEPAVEADSRFPSGPWTGFFLQPGLTGRQWMELHLTFRAGTLRGEGRDVVGKFLIVGRYDVSDGKCWWTKRYLGRHDIAYSGYNEGKGVWGMWEDPKNSTWRGGFRIWPEAMGDPYALRVAEEVDVPASVDLEISTPAEELAPV
ncbi:MAG: hypothetical protein U0835_12030 [Isosphaeraceae bacterium]